MLLRAPFIKLNFSDFNVLVCSGIFPVRISGSRERQEFSLKLYKDEIENGGRLDLFQITNQKESRTPTHFVKYKNIIQIRESNDAENAIWIESARISFVVFCPNCEIKTKWMKDLLSLFTRVSAEDLQKEIKKRRAPKPINILKKPPLELKKFEVYLYNNPDHPETNPLYLEINSEKKLVLSKPDGQNIDVWNLDEIRKFMFPTGGFKFQTGRESNLEKNLKTYTFSICEPDKRLLREQLLTLQNESRSNNALPDSPRKFISIGSSDSLLDSHGYATNSSDSIKSRSHSFPANDFRNQFEQVANRINRKISSSVPASSHRNSLYVPPPPPPVNVISNHYLPSKSISPPPPPPPTDASKNSPPVSHSLILPPPPMHFPSPRSSVGKYMTVDLKTTKNKNLPSPPNSSLSVKIIPSSEEYEQPYGECGGLALPKIELPTRLKIIPSAEEYEQPYENAIEEEGLLQLELDISKETNVDSENKLKTVPRSTLTQKIINQIIKGFSTKISKDLERYRGPKNGQLYTYPQKDHKSKSRVVTPILGTLRT